MATELYAERNEAIRRMAALGRSLNAIACVTGLSPERIRQIVRRDDPAWQARYRQLANERGARYRRRWYTREAA